MKNLNLRRCGLLGAWTVAVSVLAVASIPAGGATVGDAFPTQPAPTQSEPAQPTLLSPDLAPHVQLRHLTGADYVVDVRVSNMGQAFSGPFQTRTRISTYGWGWRTVVKWVWGVEVTVQVWGPGWNQVADFVTPMSLGPRSYKDFSSPAFTYSDFIVPRAIRVEVTADTGNVVRESSEANNSTTTTFVLYGSLGG